ncbi:DUF2793 domain-containing protein [Sulfitobacter sp.]|uniref:DUF2793 domain-containing protein n=1 Tax=Sulfitobacter sp. TaxID=1903071 RepID=UPI0030025867
MPDSSPRLSLPYIQPTQAQKHVTHNEALRLLDLLVQLRITEFDAVSPPEFPQDGSVYALGVGANGDWTGQDGRLARYSDNAWHFIDTPEGGLTTDAEKADLYVHHNGAWRRLMESLESLGVGTAADAVNRLAVASEATLLTHAGAGHQLKINKAAAGDTASLLYQTGFSGRAEMGLAGDDGFSIKVSPDGAAWTTALQLDPLTGHASGSAIQTSASDTTPGQLMRTDYGYGRGNALGPVGQTAGVPTGALVERGSNANGSYTKYADGTLLCWQSLGTQLDTTLVMGSLFSSDNEVWIFPAPFANDNIFMGASSDVVTRWCSARVVNNERGIYRQFGSSASSALSNTRLYASGRWF